LHAELIGREVTALVMGSLLFCTQSSSFSEVCQLVQESYEGCSIVVIAIELECASESDTNQDLEVVRKTSDEGEQFLRDAHALGSRLLGVRKEREEIDDLLAKHTSLTNMRKALGPLSPEGPLDVIDRREENFDVEDETLRHPDASKISPAAYMPEHLRDAGRRALFKGREDGPYPEDLLLHRLLLLSQARRRL
jgi:hypothetical protein